MEAKKTGTPEGAPVSFETQHKDTAKITQLQIFYEYLRRNIATCTMVSECTGIRQKCCTRYKRILEKNGYLYEAYEGKCKYTGFKAMFLTTNRLLMPKLPQQLELFPL